MIGKNKIIPRGYPDRESFGAISEIAIMLKAAGLKYAISVMPDECAAIPGHPFSSTAIYIDSLDYTATVYAWAESRCRLTKLEDPAIITVARRVGGGSDDICGETDIPSEAAESIIYRTI
jgi:hypothetical protein